MILFSVLSLSLFRSYSVLSFLLLFSSLICILGLNWLVSSSCFFSFYSNAFTFYTILYDFLIKPLVLNLCLWWYLDLDECLVLYLNPYPYLYPYFRKAAYIQINKTNIFIIFIILILLFLLLYQYYSQIWHGLYFVFVYILNIKSEDNLNNSYL